MILLVCLLIRGFEWNWWIDVMDEHRSDRGVRSKRRVWQVHNHCYQPSLLLLRSLYADGGVLDQVPACHQQARSVAHVCLVDGHLKEHDLTKRKRWSIVEREDACSELNKGTKALRKSKKVKVSILEQKLRNESLPLACLILTARVCRYLGF